MLFGKNKNSDIVNYDFFKQNSTIDGEFQIVDKWDKQDRLPAKYNLTIDVDDNQHYLLRYTVRNVNYGECILYICTTISATSAFTDKYELHGNGPFQRIIGTKINVKYMELEENVYIAPLENLELIFEGLVNLTGTIMSYKVKNTLSERTSKYDYSATILVKPDEYIQDIENYKFIKTVELDDTICYVFNSEFSLTNFAYIRLGDKINFRFDRNSIYALNTEIPWEYAAETTIESITQRKGCVELITVGRNEKKYHISIKDDEFYRSFINGMSLMKELDDNTYVDIYERIGEVIIYNKVERKKEKLKYFKANIRTFFFDE